MRIGINLLFLIPREVGGTQTYTTCLLRALSEIDDQNEYFLFINQESRCINWPNKANFQIIFCPVNAKNKPWRLLWEQTIFIRFLRKYQINVLHSLGYISPLFVKLPSIVTIHDLNYRFVPQSMSFLARIVQKILVERSIKIVNQIIAVSEFTKKQIVEYLHIPPGKITVTFEAAKSPDNTIDDIKAHEQKLLEKFNLRKPYIMSFSSINPHKNIHRLLEAYELACNLYGLNTQLVVVGHLPRKIKNRVSFQNTPVDNRVIFTGYLDESDLVTIFHGAILLVFPSLYEGFGLPVLEAMQLGVPVACSDRGSIPEVAGSAAVYFNPDDIDQIASTISSIVTNEDKRRKLIKLGYEQTSHFSWRNTALATISVYNKILTNS